MNRLCAVLLIAALLAFGCIGDKGAAYRHPTVIRNSSAAPPCDVISSTYDALECIASQGPATGNASECEGLQENGYGPRIYVGYYLQRDYCYASLAVRTRNASLCGRIGAYDLKTYCRNWIAGKLGNISICENMGGRDFDDRVYSSCIEYFAKKTGGSSNYRVRDAGESFCSRVNDSYDRSSCFKQLASSIDDATLCDSILGFPTKRAECIYDLAVRHANLSLCGRILMSGYTEPCYVQVYTKIAEEKKDATVCENIPVESRDYCYSGVAVATQDSSLCDMISKENVKYGSVELTRAGTMLEPGCYAQIAALKRMPSLCDRIPTQKLKDDCYSKAR